MKKLLISLLATLFVSGALAQTSFPDIPDNHWAADAVAEIVDLGIVIGFPDGTFRGNEAFTRYQAALVVSRLLDVINEDIDARFALSEEDLASLRNALQELASDVAAQGVRLSSVESSVASLSDDVASSNSRLDELERLLAGFDNTDPDVLRDLLNQLASQRVAVDTAQAQAESAEALANDASDAANAAASRARENAAAIDALNTVVQGLGERINALEQGRPAPQAGQGVPAGISDRVARNEADIANIREFVILLRRDQVALRDRVAALEAGGDIAALEERVTALENNPLGLSGSIGVEYRVERIIGEAFDVDRAYGLNNERSMDASVFSSGTADVDGDGDQTGVGEVAQDRADITGNDTPVTATLDLNVDFGNAFDAAGSPSALNQFSAAVSIDLTQGHVCEDAGCAGGGTFEAYVFTVDEFTVTFDPIGGDAISFTYGEEVSVELTPYVFGLDEQPGFVVSIGAPDMLAFLDPTITAAHTSADQDSDGDLDYFKTGVRLGISPIEGFTLGATYGRAAANAADKDDVLDNNVDTNVYGVDGSVSLAIFDLNFEYASGSIEGATPGSKNVLFVELDVDTGALPLLTELSANYRDIPADWDAYGLVDGNDFPYDEDQAGFKVEAGLGLFILDVNAYFDSYATGTPNASVNAFGADVEADLFSGFALTGFYHQISVDGVTVDSAASTFDADEQPAPGTSVERDGSGYDTGFGVGLVHDGESANALIDGLNLEVAYSQLEADFSKSVLMAAADMELSVSILNLTPYASYETVNDADVGSDDTTTLKVGTGLSTAQLGVFFAPSLEAAVNYRTTDHSDAADYTASEMQWSVGLVFNEFLFDNSSLTAKYGSWTGTNVNATDAAAEGATDISAGDANNGLDQSVSGYELVWNYFDLEMGYGVYVADEGGASDPSSGQVFSISYSVDF